MMTKEEKEEQLKYCNHVNSDLWDEHTKVIKIENMRHFVKFDEDKESNSVSHCNYCGSVFFFNHKTIKECRQCADCNLISIDPKNWHKLEEYNKKNKEGHTRLKGQ